MHEKNTFSVVPKASPWRPNHVTICLLRHSGESLQNGQLELLRRNWYFARETHKETAVSVWTCQAGFWKSTGTSCQLWSKHHGVCEIALTEVFATQMGVMRHSKTVWLWMCCGHLHAEADVIQHFLRSLLVSELFLLFWLATLSWFVWLTLSVKDYVTKRILFTVSASWNCTFFLLLKKN